ncbi:hypothetical protein [Corynebacterium diphtheriae]|uniref:hypothetical protein n=1 Tax=Corynebacterium diphtheriae TaxID=1717 RepID=UPI0015F4D569|nr:hypothetical protein [Corynebacterium diphtheriae]
MPSSSKPSPSMNAPRAGSLEYSATTSSTLIRTGRLRLWQPRVLRDHVIHSLLDLPIIDHPTRIYVRLPRYRCTNKRCLQKTLRTGLACAPE